MDSADAHRIAALMVKTMQDEVSTEYSSLQDAQAHSFRDVIFIGLSTVQAMRQGRRPLQLGDFPVSAEMMAAMSCLPFDPTPLEALFAQGLEASEEDPKELEAAILHAVIPKRRMAEMMAEAAERLREQAKALGKQDERSMYERWMILQPAVLAVLELQKTHPRTEMSDALRFLAPEYPGITLHLEAHLPTMRSFIGDSKEYADAKHLVTRAQLLASAIVAKDFGLKESYCLQVLKAQRRAVQGRMREPRVGGKDS